MPIKTTCPECDKAYTLADTMEGKSVKCKGCGQPFKVQAAANGIAAKPSNGKAVKAAVKKRVADDDDEVPVKKKGGMGTWLLIGGGLVAVLMLFVCGGVGIGGYLIYRSYSDSDESSSTASTSSDKDKDKQAAPPTGAPASKVSKENFDKIKGGMTTLDMQNLLGFPSDVLAPLDVQAKQFVGDQGSAQTWRNGNDSVTVGYNNQGRVACWAANFNGLAMGYFSDPQYVVKPNSPTNSKITVDNFNKIKGGMNPVDMFNLFGLATKKNVKPDAVAAQMVGDRGMAETWSSGADSVTVNYNPEFKATCWSATIGGVSYNGSDATYAVKPGTTTPMITKANYDKIKGGMQRIDLQFLLGNPSQANQPPDAVMSPIVSDKGKVFIWKNGQDTITVALNPDGKAACWSGNIGGQALPLQTDLTYAVKPGNANPNAAVTKANFDKITQGMAAVAVLQLLGQPSFQSQVEIVKATRTTPAHAKFHAKWTDGQGGEITVHFISGAVSEKANNGKLK